MTTKYFDRPYAGACTVALAGKLNLNRIIPSWKKSIESFLPQLDASLPMLVAKPRNIAITTRCKANFIVVPLGLPSLFLAGNEAAIDI